MVNYLKKLGFLLKELQNVTKPLILLYLLNPIFGDIFLKHPTYVLSFLKNISQHTDKPLLSLTNL